MQNKDVAEVFKQMQHDEIVSFVKTKEGKIGLVRKLYEGEKEFKVEQELKAADLITSKNVFDLFMVRSADMYKKAMKDQQEVINLSKVVEL